MSQRPEYDRIRRFLAKGGVLQREVIESADFRAIVWRAAARDGRSFDADTCEWFAMRRRFTLDHGEGWLQEGPPGIFRRVPDIHPTLGESAAYKNPDRQRPSRAKPQEGP